MSAMEERRFVRIAQADNVGVALAPLRAGERALDVTLRQDVPAGHKFALRAIAQGERVISGKTGVMSRQICPAAITFFFKVCHLLKLMFFLCFLKIL